MAVRRSYKKTSVRRTVRRRVNKIQGFTNSEIQTLEAALAILQTALDPNRNSAPEWFRRSLRPSLYNGLGKVFRALYNPFPKQILRKGRMEHVLLASKTRRVSRGSGKDKPSCHTSVRGGSPGDAQLDFFDAGGRTTPGGQENI